MKRGMERVIAGSRIIAFFANFNRNLLTYFYASKIHELFIKSNAFFRKAILTNADGSVIIGLAKKIRAHTEIRDIGIFITLVVFFNTLAMAVFGKEIDVFSICARVAFFVLGIALYIWKKNAK